MEYKIQTFEENEKRLFYCLDGEATQRHGAIGYMRADFGRNGCEFWTTWFDSQKHLKSNGFKREFNGIINSLRDDGQESPFASRKNLSVFCLGNPSTDCFKIRTRDYSYYFRCQPSLGNYDVYCYAYNNDYLIPELAGQHKLPRKCFSILPSSGEMIMLSYGESKYTPFASNADSTEIRRIVDDMNEGMGVTRAQEEAMLAGSMFGFDKPAAKPWNYYQDGKPRLFHQLKKNEPER